MAFEIEEIDVEEDSLTILFNLADATGVSVSALLAERKKVQAYEEFWADPCWIQPLDTTS